MVKAEHVLVATGGVNRTGIVGERINVTQATPVVHRDLIQHVHDLRQQRWSRNREPGVLHVMGVSGVVAPASAGTGTRGR